MQSFCSSKSVRLVASSSRLQPRPSLSLTRSAFRHLPSASPSASFRRTYATPPPPPPSPSQTYDEARRAHYSKRNRSLLLYSTATVVLVTAAAYLAVPLYRAFCSATGYAGTPRTDARFDPERLSPDPRSDKRVKVTFNADASDALPWSFTPQQKEIYVLPGETALAFYTATNHSKDPIVGIATYNVTPNNIAPYFAKVECFCFEEQRIQGNEEVDLPVFFFIDRDFLDDPLMKDVKEVTLSYTFFRARRDHYGNLVPAEGPLAVAGSVPVV